MSQTTTYQVRGMTCGHCAGSVRSEIEALPDVTGVTVDVVPQGDSTVTVTSAAHVPADAVGDAVQRAGYDVVGTAG